MSRDEQAQAREIVIGRYTVPALDMSSEAALSSWIKAVRGAAFFSGARHDEIDTVLAKHLFEALRGASGGGVAEHAFRAGFAAAEQALGAHGSEPLLRAIEDAWNDYKLDHPAENAKSSGEVRAELDGDHDDLR